MKIGGEYTTRTNDEADLDGSLRDLLRSSPIFDSPHWSLHANVFLKRQSLSRLLYLDALYKEIVDIPGVICEFGVLYGATLVTLMILRGIYEPYNHSRHIYGFDTFEGFPSVDPKDGDMAVRGDFSVPARYELTLEQTLALHERNSPISHIRKFGLIKGDVSQTLPKWLKDNPHVVVAMAIFDMDLYRPTLDALNLLRPHFMKDTVIAFDDLNSGNLPGETAAVMEAIGLNNLAIRRGPYQSHCCWARFRSG